MPSNHLILCCPLLLPSIFPSIRVFSKESVLCIRWPKDWSFSFSISPSNGYSGLISFRVDWLDLLAVQGTHKSLLQHHSSKASILWHAAFFIVQLSHPSPPQPQLVHKLQLSGARRGCGLIHFHLRMAFAKSCLSGSAMPSRHWPLSTQDTQRESAARVPLPQIGQAPRLPKFRQRWGLPFNP